MPFLTEPEPPRGAALPVAPGVRRVVAPNPGVMTYHGTNTYLVGTPEGLVVLDPGPDDAAHVRAVLDAAGAPVARILLSHTHRDHLGAVAALRAATGAPVAAFATSAAAGFTPDVPLHDGDRIAGLTALHTPGHASDHLCFAGPDGILFSADHVMSWSSTVVSPPDGDMAAYFASLRRLLERDDLLFLPGHGPPLPEPRALVAELLHHRQAREAAIAAALGPSPVAPAAIVAGIYSQVHPTLLRAAERNVIAHLQKLAQEGRAVHEGEGWRAA
ncbi:MAG TPA: MBL fold metallo-hydrolase [Acetobacteraceae bacterium]|nr:MBL fold metallo-hydrolase [Acetobacteraceae bacterium]